MAQEEELLRLQMQAHLAEAMMACTVMACTDVPGALADLASLVNQGQLTQEEFRVAKQQVLSGPPLRDALFTQVARFQEWEDRRRRNRSVQSLAYPQLRGYRGGFQARHHISRARAGSGGGKGKNGRGKGNHRHRHGNGRQGR